MQKIIILTGSELRHDFMRISIAANPQINVIFSICEGQEKSLKNRLKEDDDPIMHKHEAMRARSEEDFFGHFCKYCEDKSNPIHIPKGEINDVAMTQRIISTNPDLIICYGCSLLKGEIIQKYAGKILNLHLGLSPYYRGSGTNFFCLVHGNPEYFGASFIYLNEGIDEGEIIHQIRGRIYENDNIHLMGNRLIVDCSEIYQKIILGFQNLQKKPQIQMSEKDIATYRKDFNAQAVQRLYDNFNNKMIEEYLSNQAERNVKIIEQDHL